MEPIYLFFTGGWDSTFRFLQLSSEPICIQPLYLIDKNREGTDYEKKAMLKIIDIVQTNGGGKYGFKAKVLDIKYYAVDWILEECRDDEISVAYKYLKEKYAVGEQYEWFALLTKYLDTKMECGVVHQYHGKVENAILGEGILEPVPNDVLPGRYHVLPKKDNDKAFLVFENLIFPIINLTKEDEQHIASENGWMDIMKETWFCFTPIRGEPCGLCSPCEDAMNTGMDWRMPPSSQRRYKHRKIYRFLKKVKRRLGKVGTFIFPNL